MKEIFALISGLVVFGTAIPYLVDIYSGRVKPLRSTRLMFLVLISLTLLLQRNLGTGITLVVTIAETLASILLFASAMKYGVGGYRKTDLACYVAMVLSVTIWITTNNAAVALAFTILADFVAFLPVIIRTAKEPRSETQLFYWGGVIGPVFALLSTSSYLYKEVVFVIYLGVVNFMVALLINRQYLMKSSLY